MINFLIDYKKEQGDWQPTLDDEEDDDVPRELPKMSEPKLSGRGTRRRTGVSAEPMSSSDLTDEPTRVIPKTEDDKAHIRAAVKNNFLFTSLDRDQMSVFSTWLCLPARCVQTFCCSYVLCVPD